jgi:hypothetical protein
MPQVKKLHVHALEDIASNLSVLLPSFLHKKY